jgi:hypothetical protein
MVSDGRKEVHVLAAGVHGALVALHVLGAVYNARRHNRWQLLAHVAGVAFSPHSVGHHLRESR